MKTLEVTPIPVGRRIAVIIYEAFLVTALVFASSLITVKPLYFFVSTQSARTWWTQVIAICVLGLYFSWSWSNGRRTLAMKTWKVRLYTLDGYNVPLRQAFLRFTGLIAPWLVAEILITIIESRGHAILLSPARNAWIVTAILFPWIFCIFHPKRIPFHDAFSGTRLIFNEE